MKLRNWILVLVTVVACCLLFSACANTEDDEIKESESVSETESQTGETALSLTIDGKDISEYKIVYAHSPLEKKISATGKTIGEDLSAYLLGENIAYDFDYQTAVRLQQLIQEKTGKTLELVKDSSGEAGDYEILVGQTLRMETASLKDWLKYDTYTCKLDGTRYVICGKDYGTTWHAVDAWEKLLTDTLAAGKTELDMKTAGDLSGTYEMKKVACVGDSITRGSQAVNALGSNAETKKWGSDSVRDTYYEEYLAYPCVAQRNLWQEYVIYNFGVGGTSMSHKDLYTETKKYQTCLQYSNRNDFDYDLVLIMLGTNDATDSGKSAWSQTEKKAYLDATRSLVNVIKAGSPDAQFVLMNVPHRCDGDAPLVSDASARETQLETVQTLAGEGQSILYYDMERFNKDHMTADPTKEGAAGVDEKKLHEDYYNIKQGANDTTHFNYKGYYVTGMEMVTLMEHLLNNGEATEYLW
ncbi:MAG: SGNH/GDSL hydrolase family protein [Clostridia bacterium]|nr:SGNH/GDSL hydrolase family protein [Clostridia bacterium]